MAQPQPPRRTSTNGPTQERFGRLRSASLNAASRILEYDPAPGMWAATGAAIAHAPNLTDLQSEDIGFDAYGHGARQITSDQHILSNTKRRAATFPTMTSVVDENTASEPRIEKTIPNSLTEIGSVTTSVLPPRTWKHTLQNGLHAAWTFVNTPTGFCITLYGLNVVAWGGMLFLLFLKAAPAMNHPNNGDADSSPRKIWIEIDSQILNALFCLTSWGLAPWRFRDAWWLLKWRCCKGEVSKAAKERLAARNESWFRMPVYVLTREDDSEQDIRPVARRSTFSGDTAPPTASWKMDFVVWMLVLNSLFQVGMAFMMWHWNRFDRPAWGAGLFIGLGCAVSMFSGIMCWWEGRKIKKIEGPKVVGKDASEEV